MPHQKQLNDLKQQHSLELQKLREEYENRIRNFDRVLRDAVKQEEQRVKSAWTWKIGSIVVAPIVAIQCLVGRAFQSKNEPDGDEAGVGPVKNIDVPSDSLKSQVVVAGVVDNEVYVEPGKAVLGGILDTFTYNCFKFEFNILRPGCENWQEVFSQHTPGAVFVESAWRGNENSWKNQIGSFSKTSDINLNALLAWCREQSIPTIFWNKEDPVHFDYFIKDARKFDYIFTTDEGVIPKYQEAAGHQNVFALPFAAQPAIHNPVRNYPRDGKTCFAGTYYNNRYVERRSDMDILLKPSLDFGLEIYDRNFGATGQDADNYRFPDIYQSAIKGRLDYDDMVLAYKRYKTFLNVNSVRHSSTMFARRVFELLSCGTPVISTYSKGIIDLLGEDTVMITESEQDTRRHLENLLNDDQFWWKRSLTGMRKVMEKHTYTNRTSMIFEPVGLPFREPNKVKFRILCPVASMDDVRWFSVLLARQVYKEFIVILILAPGFKPKAVEKEEMAQQFNFTGKAVDVVHEGQPVPKKVSGGLVYRIFMHSGHYYGQNFLRDFALAIGYSGAEKLGKASWFSGNGNGNIRLINNNMEFRHVDSVHPGTLFINESIIPPGAAATPDVKHGTSPTADIVSIDPYNFLEYGRQRFNANPKEVINQLDF
jgi:spore maturation protein CgeB